MLVEEALSETQESENPQSAECLLQQQCNYLRQDSEKPLI
jgi:hypothetical protein